MIRRTWNSILSHLKGRTNSSTDVIFAPAYDDGTMATSSWIATLGLEKAKHCIGDDARHDLAVELIDHGNATGRILIFVGHGKAAGLLTDPNLGKVGSAICSSEHGCLVDTEDIKPTWKGLQIVAWACQSGSYFGPSIAGMRGSGFLGFAGPINIIINHPESVEQIWKPVMKELFSRIMVKRIVESHDAEWLSRLLLDVRKKIKDGSLNTGIHNRANTIFLKAAAKNAVVHISRG